MIITLAKENIFLLFITEAYTRSYLINVGRSTNESQCDVSYIAPLNSSITVITDRGLVDPPCVINFIPMDANFTFFGACYTIHGSNLTCNNKNNTISVHVGDFFLNETYFHIVRNESESYGNYLFGCNNTVTLDPQICPVEKPIALSITMFVAVKDTRSNYQESNIASLSFYTSSIQSTMSWHSEDFSEFQYASEDEKQKYVRLLCFGEDECYEQSEYIKEKEVSSSNGNKPGIDVNNIITILGGVMTTLVTPIVLLFIRHRYRKHAQNNKETQNRNPGDGCDHVDGKHTTKDSDDDEPSRAQLLTPRNSAFSLDSFHSTFSSV